LLFFVSSPSPLPIDNGDVNDNQPIALISFSHSPCFDAT